MQLDYKCGLVRNLGSNVFKCGVEYNQGGKMYGSILLEDVGVASTTTPCAL